MPLNALDPYFSLLLLEVTPIRRVSPQARDSSVGPSLSARPCQLEPPTKGLSLSLGDYYMLMSLGVSRSKLNKHPLLSILYGKLSRLSSPWHELVGKNYVQETSTDAARLSQDTEPVLVGVLSAWSLICVSSQVFCDSSLFSFLCQEA